MPDILRQHLSIWRLRLIAVLDVIPREEDDDRQPT
jgi:hypothetical protein